ncbi:MAG: ABC transporter permease [Propioniciclava sp.]
MPSEPAALVASRIDVSRGLVTMLLALSGLVLLSIVVAPSSLSVGVLLGMIPFAVVLAIVGLGQMLVVQQAGIDLSVPGAISLSVVIITHIPYGDSSKLGPAVLLCAAAAILAGLVNGVLVDVLGMNSVITTLGANALLFGMIIVISGGVPRTTTALLAEIMSGTTADMPHSVLVLALTLAAVVTLVKKTPTGRRFEGVGASPAAAHALGFQVRTHTVGAYVGAQLLYALAGITLGGVVAQPTAYLGNNYLLPSVAVVVLGGTSLLGGRGYPGATVAAAIFLTQLEQFSLALGVPFAARTLMQAVALVVGVAIYTVRWGAVGRRILSPNHAAKHPGRPSDSASTPNPTHGR